MLYTYKKIAILLLLAHTLSLCSLYVIHMKRKCSVHVLSYIQMEHKPLSEKKKIVEAPKRTLQKVVHEGGTSTILFCYENHLL